MQTRNLYEKYGAVCFLHLAHVSRAGSDSFCQCHHSLSHAAVTALCQVICLAALLAVILALSSSTEVLTEHWPNLAGLIEF